MSDIPNADERDFWSGDMGLSWVTSQEEMDTQLAEVAQLVLRHANLQPGDRAIDIGAGTGALSLMAAEHVGENGRILTTDISEPLLELAAKRGNGLKQMDTFLGDAQAANWPEGDFDHAISRFGVMFFSDPPAAFANIARALRPGGQITFAAWAPASENPFWHLPTKHAVQHLGAPPKPEPNTPGPMGLADIDLACERLEKGGLVDISGTVETVHLRHPNGPRAFANLCIRIGAAKRIVNHFDASEAEQKAIEDTLAEEFLQFEQPDGSAAIPAAINLLRARRPA